MKHLLPTILSVFLLLIGSIHSIAQDEPVRRKNTLTHHMSPEEKALFHTVGEGFEATEPPPGVIHNIAEFEKMEGVLIAYPGYFGISYELIAGMSELVPVTTVVENNSQLTYVTNQYENNGVNMDNTIFIVTPLDSYWTRDYGPWYIRYGEDQIGIVDFVYNRPERPNDNAIPAQMADHLGIESFAMELITAGGNYMTEGYGVSSSSDLTWDENPDLTSEEIDQMLLDYCGIDTYHVLPDPNDTYIDHIDCWGKFLDVDKVLIREVPESHPQYDEIEETADYYANEISAWGNNYQVYRVWTPSNEPYTNSLILNNTVFLPIMDGLWDDEAIDAYEDAMPGYEILTFTGSWQSTDALHCRTKGIADRNMVYIEHFPLLGDQEVFGEYEIEAIVTAYSGEEIVSENVKVIFWINGILQDEITMTYEGDKLYTASIPAGEEGSQMAYYITAEDEDGNVAHHPIIGEPDPHIFYVGEQLFATIGLSANEIITSANEGNTVEETIIIENLGGLDLNYTIEFSDTVFVNYSVEDSPAPNAWDSNTWTELGWTEVEMDDEEGEIASLSLSFDWDVDQYVDETTIYVKSPGGDSIVIAAGLTDGNYEISTEAFNGEQMQGTWRLWLTDGYGDGGHQATNITMTIMKTYTIQPWLSVEPLEGTIQPGNSESVTVNCAASTLPVGDYEGMIWVSSNDLDFPTIEIPVYFTVDVESGNSIFQQRSTSLTNYPNPFTTYTIFEMDLEESTNAKLVIYDGQGALIRSLSDEVLPQGNSKIVWDGKDQSGMKLPAGIYYFMFDSKNLQKSGKLILH